MEIIRSKKIIAIMILIVMVTGMIYPVSAANVKAAGASINLSWITNIFSVIVDFITNLFKGMGSVKIQSVGAGIKRTNVDPSKFNNNDNYPYSKKAGRNWNTYCNRMANYLGYVEDASKKYGVSADLIMAIIMQESHANPNATSSTGCRGLMQVSPKYASDYVADELKKGGTYNLYDPKTNIYTGTNIIGSHLKTKTLESALAKYSGNASNYANKVKEYRKIINELYSF